ncbi:PSD1 and planctomycete cytochrome C domain-containing protein [Zavarzinella formosa]|uniref:PSD1 and planctomycete cytochrome C domain-containing protein n=1 Tax=Zavarzinella formosa TaxID=360055 RepID=UPI0003689A45|nr:PSD1 and planctomycete cytochrome C domain-containing protein [Zavarzinella formosa]
MRWILCTLPLFGFAGVLSAESKPEFTPEALAFYEKDVLPILKANCYKCHADGKLKGNFSLLTRAAILKGGDLGPAIDPKKIDDSILLKAINHKDMLEMPPSGKLPAAQLDILTKWVKADLPMKDGQGASAHAEPKAGTVTAESKNYWAYKPVARPAVPSVKNGAWVANPIDAFILSKLELKNLTPSKPADKLALVRRLYYDLIGLPPTPEQVDSFVNDQSPDAYEKLVDQLLASPHYGEKWGRHWLDVVRYGETNGYERDGPKPYVWRFRDYVIKSFNADKPYDQFIREQLAGDEINPNDPDCVVATGYYRLGLWDDEPADREQAQYDEFDDYVATTAQTFLGMTMNCARCHDHKIDPIPQADYYRLLAFFRDVRQYGGDRNTRSSSNLTDITSPAIRATYEKELAERKAKIEKLKAEMERIENEAIKKMPAADQRASEGAERPLIIRKVPKYLSETNGPLYALTKSERQKLEKLPLPHQELALSVNNCIVNPPQTTIMVRGLPHVKGAPVTPNFPEIISTNPAKIPAPKGKTAGRRIVLADWIASKDNPSTARVMANRIWQGHFGRGIVSTPNDFGKFGTPPTHPELLDWLASEFTAGDWKIKKLHKTILMSNTYRQTAVASEDGLKADPANFLLGRFSMRRLAAEEVRDSVLALSGQLNLKAGGESVYPKIPKEILAGQSVPGQGWPTSPKEEGNRRSVYVHIKRSLQVPVLAQYDQADADSSCPVRYTTTVPTQALGMINGEFTNEAATELANRLKKEAPNLEDQLRRAVRLATGRTPTEAELKADLTFVKKLQTEAKLSAEDALRQYCLMTLNLNEFVYVD